MNRIYRTIFNRRTGAWQAVSEIARCHGGSGQSRDAVKLAVLLLAGGLGAVVPGKASAACEQDAIAPVTLTAGFHPRFIFGPPPAEGCTDLNVPINVAESGGSVGIIGSGPYLINSLQPITGPGNWSLFFQTAGTTWVLAAESSATGTLGLSTFGGPGTLQVGNGATAGSYAGNINMGTPNTSVVFNRSDTVSHTGTLSGIGNVTKAGTGTLDLAGLNIYTGATTVQAGTLRSSSSNTLATASTHVVDAGATLDVTGTVQRIGGLAGAGTVVIGNLAIGNNNADTTFSGTISGPGELEKIGTGTLTLTGANTYAGRTVVSGGTLALGGGGITGSSELVLAGGGLAALENTVTTFQGNTFAAGTTSSMSAAAGKTLTVTGDTLTVGFTAVARFGNASHTGTVVLQTANMDASFGGIDVAGGTLRVGNAAVGAGIGTANGVTVAGGATLDTAGVTTRIRNLQGSGAITTGSNALAELQIAAGAFAGTISGSSLVRKEGLGTLVLSGNNTYGGGTQIAGTLQVGNGGATGSLGGGGVVNNGSLVFNRTGTLSVNAGISGTGTLTQAGAGVLALNNANSYGGGTFLNGGTLRIGNDTALGTGTLTIGAGTTLASAAPRRITNNILVTGDFKVFPGGTLFNTSAFRLDGNMDLGGAQRTITNTMDYNLLQFGQLAIGGAISNGGLIFADAGFAPADNVVFFRLEGNSANTYTGETIVGTNVALLLAKNGGVPAVGGDLTIRNEAAATIVNHEQIVDHAVVRFEGNGRLQVGNTFAVGETIGSLADDGTGAAQISLHANGGSRLNVSSGQFSGHIDQGAAATVSLAKQGAGTLVLSGANTYVGTTLVSAGTLQIGNGGSSGTLGSGDVVNNASLQFNRADSVTVANAISGSGNVTQAGTGITALTGLNTYTGGTTVAAGTLAIAGMQALGTGDVTVAGGKLSTTADMVLDAPALTFAAGQSSTLAAANGTTLAVHPATLTLAAGAGVHFGSAGEAGTIEIGGSGTTAADATSQVFIDAGTLRAQPGSTRINALTGSAQSVTVAAGATLEFNNLGGTVRNLLGAGTVTTAGNLNVGQGNFAGEITGPGRLVKDATAAPLILTGNNSYTGTTTIAGGVLQVGNGGTTGRLGAGNVANSGQLVFNRADTITIGNDITGTGGLQQAGSGTVALTANNSYSGTTSITGGVLQVGDGGTGGTLGTGNVVNSSSLIFNRSDSMTVANTISGTGNVTQSGVGTTTLSGVNTYSGGTTVSGGTLALTNGSAAGSGTIFLSGAQLLALDDITLTQPLSLQAGQVNTISAQGGKTLILANDFVNIAPNSVARFGSATETGTVVLNASDYTAWGGYSLEVAGGTLRSHPNPGWNFGLGVVLSAPSMVTIAAGATIDTLREDARVQNLQGAGAILADGAWIIDAGNFAGSISGAGGVQKASAGTLVLSGDNSYSASTWISGGTLRVGNGGTSGSLGTGPIDNDATVVFDRSDVFTVGNRLNGPGTYVYAGPGRAVLTGLNTHTGTTLIVDGTLQVGDGGSGGALGAGGAVVNDSALVFNRSGTLVVTNPISGSGTVTQAGPGTTVLTGANTYAGPTAITAGTLQVGNGGTAGSLGTGGVANNGALVFNRSDAVLVGNAISGTGSITHAGTGALALTADNTYTGATTIVAGTLLVGAGGTTGTLGSGNVTNNGALVFNRADVANVANDIAGSGSVAHAGPGTLVASGTNTYAGGTTIATGTLQVGNGGATGSLGNGGVTNNGALVVNRSGTLTLPAPITGTGSLTQAGPGTTILAADNSYGGTTTIAAGTLQVGNGGTAGSLGTGAVTNNAALAFKRSDSVTLAQSINGSGSLAQDGRGHLVLNGAYGYTGGTFVNAGKLTVNGSIVGNTTVNNGGTLAGTGTIGNLSVASGGALAPGNSIGTLTVAGNLTFAPGSVYRVEANAAGAADRVDAVGSGTLTINGGTVDVQPGGAGFRRNTSYTILSSAGAASGRFDGATSALAFLTPTLVYEASAVLLNLQASDALDYASVATTGNQASVANYLSRFVNDVSNAASAGLIQQIDNLTVDQARAAFTALAGSVHAVPSQVAGALGRNFSASLTARSGFSATGDANAANFATQRYASLAPGLQDAPAPMSDAPQQVAAGIADGPPGTLAPATGRGFWVQALGIGGEIESDGNGAGSRHRGGGFVFGYDQLVSASWQVGAALGYGKTSWDASTNGAAPATGKIDSAQAGLYASYTGAPWRLHLDATFADHRFDTDRTVAIGSASSTASSVHHGREWALAAQLEYPVQWGDWQLRPLAGVRYAHLQEDGFTETGAGAANLEVGARTTQNTVVSAGVRFIRLFEQGKGGVELRAVASRLLGDNDSPVSARLASQPASFTVDGTPLKRNALSLGATVNGEIARGLVGYADASYEVRGGGQNAFQLTAGIRKSW